MIRGIIFDYFSCCLLIKNKSKSKKTHYSLLLASEDKSVNSIHPPTPRINK